MSCRFSSLFLQADGTIDHVHLALIILALTDCFLTAWRVLVVGDQFDAYGFSLGGGLMIGAASGAATLRDKLIPAPERER